jgi:hypothetical protein
MNQCLLVVGYNNVRIYDVAKLRDYAQRLYGAKLVLLIEKPQPQDRTAADAVITVGLGADVLGESLNEVRAELAKVDLSPIGVLPFSDRGILLGAALATHFDLPGPSTEEALAGLDKRVYRRLDQALTQHPEGYRPVCCSQVDSVEQLRSVVRRLGGRAFIKPASEGNSRGCQVIHSIDDCESAWEALAPYRQAGILVEELIEDADEYSWDYVAGRTWITEKHTTQDTYRAEYLQIVPSRFTSEEARRLEVAGQHMRGLVSKGNGAYHNEIFHRNGRTAAVETNMRPAGMHIWDLAKISFADFDPWEAWVRWAVTGSNIEVPLMRNLYSGIHLIRPPTDGVVQYLPNIESLGLSLGIAVEQASFYKNIGDSVSSRITDNASFIGEVILSNQDYGTLRRDLSRLVEAIESGVKILSA